MVVLCLLVCVGGCSAPAGKLPKQASQVTSSPTTTSSNHDSEQDDGVFTATKLRMIDPCGWLDAAMLRTLGTQPRHFLNDFDFCGYSVKDTKGNDLNVGIVVGRPRAYSADDKVAQIDGLGVAEVQDKTGCVDEIEPTRSQSALGIDIQSSIIFDGDITSLCAAVHKLVPEVISRILTNPPLRTDTRGSLAAIDPCSMVDAQAATVVLGDSRKPM